MEIAICEDNDLDLNKLEELVSHYSLDFTSYNSGARLLKDVEERNNNFELYLLDIELGEYSGIEIAKRIRAVSPSSLIVFLTNYTEYMPLVFEVRTFDYILKPITREKLAEVIRRAKYYLAMDKNYFHFTYKKVHYVFNSSEIFYFEKKGRTAYIYHASGIFQCNMTVQEILNQLDSRFFVQIHAAYLINLKYMMGYTLKFVLMNTGSNTPNVMMTEDSLIKLPVGRKFKESVKTEIIHFYENRL